TVHVYCHHDHRVLHSFPTRRSSDLGLIWASAIASSCVMPGNLAEAEGLSIAGKSHGWDANLCWPKMNLKEYEGREDRAISGRLRSEEHTSELQSLAYLVCRLLLEKK